MSHIKVIPSSLLGEHFKKKKVKMWDWEVFVVSSAVRYLRFFAFKSQLKIWSITHKLALFLHYGVEVSDKSNIRLSQGRNMAISFWCILSHLNSFFSKTFHLNIYSLYTWNHSRVTNSNETETRLTTGCVRSFHSILSDRPAEEPGSHDSQLAFCSASFLHLKHGEALHFPLQKVSG